MRLKSCKKSVKIQLLFVLVMLSISINVVNSSSISLSTQIIVGPYTQAAGTESIEILWETSTFTTINEVHWGKTPSLGNITSEEYLSSNNLHSVKLNGLNESTKYFYKVVSDEIESPIYHFYTSFGYNDTIRFIVYGDSRGVWDNWQNTKIVTKAIENKDPFFVINTGDLVKNGLNESQWIDFFNSTFFMHNSTFYPVLGNHEFYGNEYFNYFVLPNNEKWYSYDNGPVHFIALDSNFPNSVRFSQILWLIKDLINIEKPYVIVTFHHPPFSSSEHGSSFYLRLYLKPIFEYFNVDIVFNGHDHSYERGKVNGVNYIVTGGGGAPLYDVGENWWTIYSEKTYNYCLINVNATLLTFEAIKPDGAIIDSFTL